MKREEKFGLLARLRAQEKILGLEAKELERISYHFKERARKIHDSMQPVSAAREALERELTPVRVISAGGSAPGGASPSRSKSFDISTLDPEKAAKLKALLG